MEKLIGKSGKAYETTVRYPDPYGQTILSEMEAFQRDPPSRNKKLPIFDPEHNLTERTAWILQAYSTYVAVSNNEFRVDENGNRIQDATNWGSLEDIHNAVHILTGGTGNPDAAKDEKYGGHMSKVPNSAFDPIFWLRKFS